MMEKIRAFVAIELPDEIKASLSRLLGRIKPGQEKTVKWVSPRAIHLTLKFLGDTPAEKIAEINQAIAGVAERTSPFTLELGGLGAFPNLRSPRVVWVGVRGDISVIAGLQKEIDRSLNALGFLSETRAFSPHLTLGRVREKVITRERNHLGNIISSFKIESRPSFLVNRINLMKSTLTGSGAIYDCLASLRLTGTGRK